MTTLTDLSNEELLLHIAEAERDCSTCQPMPEGPPPPICPTCGGTGKVPILSPELMRLPCPKKCSGGWIVETWAGGRRWGCYGCGGIYQREGAGGNEGRGWIPSPDAWALWALKEGLLSSGYTYSEHGEMHGASWVAVRETDTQEVWFGRDPDPKRAFLLAVIGSFHGVACVQDSGSHQEERE